MKIHCLRLIFSGNFLAEDLPQISFSDEFLAFVGWQFTLVLSVQSHCEVTGFVRDRI